MSTPLSHSASGTNLRSRSFRSASLVTACLALLWGASSCAPVDDSLNQRFACAESCGGGAGCDTSVGECRSLCDKSAANKCGSGFECSITGFCAPLGEAGGDGSDSEESDDGDGAEEDAPENGEPCDDQNQCTSDDAYADGVCTGVARECAEGYQCAPATGECMDKAAVNLEGERCQTHCLGLHDSTVNADACRMGLDGYKACYLYPGVAGGAEYDGYEFRACIQGRENGEISGLSLHLETAFSDGEEYTCGSTRWHLVDTPDNDGFVEGDVCPAGTCGESGLTCMTSIYGKSVCIDSPPAGQCLLKYSNGVAGWVDDLDGENGGLATLQGDWQCDQGTWRGDCGLPDDACDDGDPCTVDDVCLADRAHCAGTYDEALCPAE